MLNVTEKAQEEVAKYFSDNEKKPIRLFLSNGCSGPQIAMALDDAKEDDTTFEFDSVTYLVNQSLLEQIKPVVVDFVETGFKVESSLPAPSCSGCGGSCG